MLLAQEGRLEKKLPLHILDTNKTEGSNNLTANIAQTRSDGGGGSNGFFLNNRGRGQRNSGHRGGKRGGRNFQVFQGTQFNQNFQNFPVQQRQQQQQLVCQLCSKVGHSVWNCYHMFNYNFHPP